MSILRPGKDVLHLVTVVQSTAHEQAGFELCTQFEAIAKSTLIETQIDVLVSSRSLLCSDLSLLDITR